MYSVWLKIELSILDLLIYIVKSNSKSVYLVKYDFYYIVLYV